MKRKCKFCLDDSFLAKMKKARLNIIGNYFMSMIFDHQPYIGIYMHLEDKLEFIKGMRESRRSREAICLCIHVNWTIMNITTFENLLPLLDNKDLCEFDILLTNKLALDLFDYAKSKGIKEQKMCNWFQQIVSNPINMRNLVTNLVCIVWRKIHRKGGILKENFLQEPFKCPTLNESSTCKTKVNPLILLWLHH